MTATPDLTPAVRQLTALLDGVTDDQLGAPTPCEKYTLGDIVDHVNGLSLAFASAARKDLGPMTSHAPSGAAGRLEDDWRTRIPVQLAALAEAWSQPEAWDGMTQAGGVDLPGEVAGRVALNEVTVHGWDIARATGQPFAADRESIEACLDFVLPTSSPEGTPGLFGPAVELPGDAPLVDRLIGLTGRDPSWTPPAG